MNSEQAIQFALAGTITFPATFPRTVEIVLGNRSNPADAGGELGAVLTAIERPSPRVTIRRTLSVGDVRAVFIPRDRHVVDYDDGDWLIAEDIGPGVRLLLNRGQALQGIVFVAEHAPSLLEVSAGMTAAESSQYYPPLPTDRSVNHYDPYRDARLAQGTPPKVCEMEGDHGHEYEAMQEKGRPVCEGHEIDPGGPQPHERLYQTFDQFHPRPCDGAQSQ